MTSEIRTNSLKSRAGLSTVTMTDTGPMFSGITTFVDNSGFTFGVGGGTSIFTPATNILTLGTNNTEKVRIDASGTATFAGDVSIADKIIHTGDTNTAIRFPAADTISLETAGNEKLRIDNSGTVYFRGSSSSDNHRLQIRVNDTDTEFRGSSNSTTNKGFAFYSSNTNASEKFRINSNGAFGLGGATYGSSGQVLTSAGSGSVPTWTTISGTTINNNADNRLITGSGTANTLEGEANVTYEGHTFTTGLTGITPKFVLKRTGNVDSADNIFSTLQTHDANGNSVAEITVRRESANDEAYMDFETKATGQNVQGSVRIKGSNGTMYCVGSLGRSNNNQPAYFNDQVLGGTTVPSVLSLKTLTNGGETGLLIRGTSQGGGSSAPHSCIRVDATACGNNADQYGIYLRGQQQLVSDTTGYYADVYGSYSTTYCFRGHLQKQIGAYTTGTTFHSKITVTSSGGDAFHMRGYDGSSERIRINRNGDIDNTNNSYGSLSDVKLKENIVDANSQWDDIKALKVRNFNFKDDPDKVKMLGLVAQEAEAVSAGLVKTDNDIEIDESTGEGKVTGTTKYLKYSILYMKAIKALQEAQTRIEKLEQDNIALRARVTNLEDN